MVPHRIQFLQFYGCKIAKLPHVCFLACNEHYVFTEQLVSY